MSNSQDGPRLRLTSLDGLPGVAALIVLVHHSLASVPALGNVYFGAEAPTGLGWLVHSPLHLIWAGTEAVLVFFILSGLVLTLPALRRNYDWRSYFPSRIIRLYVPVIASVTLALIVVTAIPRAKVDGRGEWMERHFLSPNLNDILLDLTLLKPGWLNGPLWSLHWEVAFSILLPLYLLVATRLRKQVGLTIALSLLTSWFGVVYEHSALIYLPIFFLGCALAPYLHRPSATSSRAWPWAFGSALLGITLPWTLRPVLASAEAALFPVVAASAMILVVGSVRWAPAQRVLQVKPIQRLGTISFSLYLVHDPIVVGVASLLPREAAWLTPMVAIPLSLVLAGLFYKVVEAPSHVLAKNVARYVTQSRKRPLVGFDAPKASHAPGSES